MEFRIDAKDARYAWIQAMLLRFHYHQLGKAEKGLLLDFLQKVSGYSRIQVKRLIQQSRQTGQLQRRQRTVQGFRRTLYARRIFGSWRRLMSYMGLSQGRPPRSCVSGPGRASGRRSMLG